MNKLIVAAFVFFLVSCGGSGTTEISAEEEKKIVDSVATAVDEAKKSLLEETNATTSDVDSLLSDI